MTTGPPSIAAGGHRHQLVGGGEIGAMQLQHGRDEIGAVDLGGAQLRQVGTVAVEERVLKRGAQIGEGRGVVVLRDVAPVDAVDLEQFQQHRHRNGALVLLQEVHVGRGDAQAPAHLRLGLSLLQAEAAQAGPMKVFSIPMYPDNFTSLQIL
jgi:hypothetical protein